MGRLSFPAYLACGCSEDAEVFFTLPNGNVARLCASHADDWFDNADDDPAMEPIRVTWANSDRTLHRAPEMTAAKLAKTEREALRAATQGGWSPPLWIIPWDTGLFVRDALDLFGITEGTGALTPYGEQVRAVVLTLR